MIPSCIWTLVKTASLSSPAACEPSVTRSACRPLNVTGSALTLRS